MKRRDSDFIMSRNIKEGNKALDFLGEYHLLNALNKVRKEMIKSPKIKIGRDIKSEYKFIPWA